MPDNNEESTLINQPGDTGPELCPDSMVGEKYRIVSLIGRGGMGAVYKVHQVFLGKEFALKVLDLHKRSDLSVRRFQQEARTASQLQHANLVEVHDFGMLGENQPYLVMDLVEGESLSQTLKKSGALSIDATIALCIQICFGLMYAHEKGVVHRDIKPANIMLLHPDRNVTEGTVKVVDFGIAKLTQSDDGEIQALTKTGEIFGSPLYMSPEQCKGTAVDRRSDIYSLGCVMFECLTGSPPFFGDTAMSTMLKRLSEEPVSLKEGSLGREFPPMLENIVRRMLAVEPNDRYQDFGAVVKDLITLQRADDRTSVSPVVKDKPQKQGRLISKQTIVLVVAAIVSSVATAAYDRLVVFPEKKEPEVEAKSGEKSNSQKSAGESSKETSTAFPTQVVRALEEKYGTGLDKYPFLKTAVNPQGKKLTFISFPSNIGRIAVGAVPKSDAVGDVLVLPGEKINLQLNAMPSEDKNTLKNLVGLNITQIGFPSDHIVNDDVVACLAKLEGLEAVGLDGTSIKSLKPFYDMKKLKTLQVSGTLVPTEEFRKIRRLNRLKELSFGPVGDPLAVFEALAKSNQIVNLSYIGARFDRTEGKGLTKSEVAAIGNLSKLRRLSIRMCPDFDDSSLEQLLCLRDLRMLEVRDCGLTDKSISTLKKFKNLKLLTLTTEGWTDADRSVLQRMYGNNFFNSKTKKEGAKEREEFSKSINSVLGN